MGTHTHTPNMASRDELAAEFGSGLSLLMNKFVEYLKQLQCCLESCNVRSHRVPAQVQHLVREMIYLVSENKELSKFVAVMRDKDPKLHEKASAVLRRALLTFANEERQRVEPPPRIGPPHHMKVVVIPFAFSDAFDLHDLDKPGTRAIKWCSFG